MKRREVEGDDFMMHLRRLGDEQTPNSISGGFYESVLDIFEVR
jgi:hypothetical protein